MSIKVMVRVWEHAEHKGGALLLLLALANYANDDGICWPGSVRLAKDARLTDRQTTTLIQELERKGAIATVKGGGRSKPTVFAVLVGLTDAQKETTKRILRKDFSENNSVNSTQENPEICDKETLKFVQKNKAMNTASETPKPTKNSEQIRHVDPSLDPSRESEHTRAPKQTLLSRLSEECQIVERAFGKKINPAAADAVMTIGITDIDKWKRNVRAYASIYQNIRIDALKDWYDLDKADSNSKQPHTNGTGKMAAIAENERKIQEAQQARYQPPGAHLEGRSTDHAAHARKAQELRPTWAKGKE